MIEVLQQGLYTTVQDVGRFGYECYGVPRSGAMDCRSATLANLILNNSPKDALLEMTLSGTVLKFLEPTNICISGADFSPEINGIVAPLNVSISVFPGDVLNFKKINYGFRTYLAVSEGILTPKVMGSRSMYSGVTSQSRILKGDRLMYAPKTSKNTSNTAVKTEKNHFETSMITAFKGPEFHQLTPRQQQDLIEKRFTISNQNSRMAYQLEELLENQILPITTAPVLPGTVQLTPKGNLIILMRDSQTTGGYPRVLQLTEDSINVLAQKHRGSVFRWDIIQKSYLE